MIGGDYEIINSYLDDLGQIDPKRWIFLSGQNKAFRESDLLSEELRNSHMYYIRAYRPLNIHYGAILSLAYNNKFVGVVSLYRPSNKTDFSDRDIFVLDALKKHISNIYKKTNVKSRGEFFHLVMKEQENKAAY